MSYISDNDNVDRQTRNLRRNNKAIKQTREGTEDDNSKRKSRRKKDKKIEFKFSKKKILLCLVAIIFVLGIFAGIKAHTWTVLATDMLVNKNSVVQDSSGNTIATLGKEKNKKAIKLKEMPESLPKAYVAIEDERFYKHHGVDLKRTGAAIVSYIFHFGSSSYGGSTITQQLVKNLTGDSTDSITRKVKEWAKAWELETATTKEEILEGYLNVIYVGPNLYGVEMGAEYYFNKPVSQLSLAECAFLAGINNSPNSYSPFGEKDNTEKISKRTKTVLGKMKELKYIDEESYNKAVSQVDSGLNFQKGNVETEKPVYSYHTDALISEVVEDVANKYKISKTFAENYINMAGLTIYSAQDTKIQKETETEFEKSKYRIASKKGGDPSQAAMVIMDHKKGTVLACAGGLGKKTESRPFNRATQGMRQTGSSSKPLIILAPGLNKRKFTASTIYDDTEQDFENGYHPVDYSKPLGNITVRRAVESSQNVPFVEMMEEIGPKTSIRYLKRMGITSLTKGDEGLPLSLGGLDKGISPLEMAGAYSMIANDGIYIEPTFYTKIERNNGKLAMKSKQKRRYVISKNVAYIIKDLLKQPVEGTNGTATYCKISGVDVAAKTGTTDENYDRWLCGFTPYYTAATWFGYDENETVEFNKRNPAGLIWANVMARIHSGLQSAKFEKPFMIDTVTVCADTGKIARTGCTHVYEENFLWFTKPGLCNEHSGNRLNKDFDDNKDTGGTIPQINKDIDGEEPQRDSAPVEETPNNIVSEENSNANTTTTKNTTTNSTTTKTPTPSKPSPSKPESSGRTNQTNTSTSGNTASSGTSSGGSSGSSGSKPSEGTSSGENSNTTTSSDDEN